MGAPFDELRERTGHEYHVKAVAEPISLAVPKPDVIAVPEPVVLTVPEPVFLEPVSLAVPEQLVMSLSNHVEGPPPISLNSRRKHRWCGCSNAGFDAMVFSEVYDQ
jgi:hypothetical protein